MLGRGLESLIPKRVSSGQPTQGEPADSFRTEAIGASPSSVSPTTSRGNGEARAQDDDDHRNHQTPGSGRKLSTGDKRLSVGESIFQIEVEKIKPNSHQPRRNFDEGSLKELAASIREIGVIQPLIVTKLEKEIDSGTEVEYHLIAGERRLMAAKMLGLERVPVIIKNIDTNLEKLQMAIVENLQRADLNPVETARAYARLQDEFGLTQREIAVKVGKSRETVSNAMRLLSLATEIQEALSNNHISESQARLLLTIENQAEQKSVFNDLLNNDLSVRELRTRIRKLTNNEQPTTDNLNLQNSEAKIMEDELSEILGTKVKVEKKGEFGKIVITFYSSEELKGIINKIK